jgi:hypothetical protein
VRVIHSRASFFRGRARRARSRRMEHTSKRNEARSCAPFAHSPAPKSVVRVNAWAPTSGSPGACRSSPVELLFAKKRTITGTRKSERIVDDVRPPTTPERQRLVCLRTSLHSHRGRNEPDDGGQARHGDRNETRPRGCHANEGRGKRRKCAGARRRGRPDSRDVQ